MQFGRPIGSFQALKHRMADMLVLVEMSRSASWAASYAVSTHADDADQLTHVAKAYCSDAARPHRRRDRAAARRHRDHLGARRPPGLQARARPRPALRRRAHEHRAPRSSSSCTRRHERARRSSRPDPACFGPADLVAADPHCRGWTASDAVRAADARRAGQVDDRRPAPISGWHHHDRNESSLYVVRGDPAPRVRGPRGLTRRRAGRLRATCPSCTVAPRVATRPVEPSLAVIAARRRRHPDRQRRPARR